MSIYTDLAPFDCWRTICKTSDESRNTTTTLTADSTLQFEVAASETWVFTGVIFVRTGATEDFKWGHNGPTSPTRYRLWRWTTVPAGTSFSAIGADTAYNTSGLAMTSTGTDFHAIKFEGKIENSTNAGTWSFTWAQYTSGATNTTVEKGSRIHIAKVS